MQTTKVRSRHRMRKEIGLKAIYGETGSQQFRNMTFFQEAINEGQADFTGCRNNIRAHVNFYCLKDTAGIA